VGDGLPSGIPADPELLRLVVDGAPIVMMVVDDQGVVQWINGACERLFGYRPEEVLGDNFMDHLDLGWNAAALDSVVYAMTATGLQRPMQFRVRRKDGTYFVAEVTANAQTAHPVVQGLAVYVRRWDERHLLDRVLESLAGGGDLDVTLRLLIDVMGADNLEAVGVVQLEPNERRFQRSVAAGGLAAALAVDAGDPGTPWAVARRTGEPQSVGVAALPPTLARSVTDDGGFCWCWAWPVAGPNGVEACLVLWRRAEEEIDHTARMLLEQLATLTALVLERERASTQLRHAATHDPLTGLANRARFYGDLLVALDDADHGPLVGVLYIDLDGFKPINDRLGHGVGDFVLREVGRRLEQVVRAGDLVARLGGDEFAVVCRRVDALDALGEVAARITQSVAEPIEVGGEVVRVGATVGIASSPPGGLSIDALVDAADGALYEAKAADKGSYRFAATPG
jgi:diguanylate cyclase (GGDEF)-like protein/PAS domain S-box-containing protein